MENLLKPTDSLTRIQEIIETTQGDSDLFAETLRNEQIPHLSYSQISAVEFCQYRYYLQYVLMRDPVPIPDYFTKGKLFHRIVADSYRHHNNSFEESLNQARDTIEQKFRGQNFMHLINAFYFHFFEGWSDYEIISIENPFVMMINPDLPPLVGVIDLVVKKRDKYILVDHKTGSDFYPDDELQMAIYAEYLRQNYGNMKCDFYYDHYRWVNDIDRIRKPAFQRTKVKKTRGAWSYSLARIQAGNSLIENIRTTKSAVKWGKCFQCPYRKTCYGD